MSIVSFVRGIVETWGCGLRRLGRGNLGVSHSRAEQAPGSTVMGQPGRNGQPLQEWEGLDVS